MKITHITLYEVLVPAHPGAIASDSVNKPLHKLPVGAKAGWSIQFDQVTKLLIKLELQNGLVGWGECYRGHNWETVEAICTILLGKNIEQLVLQKLPFVFSREYDGFECAVWDVYARLKEVRVVDLLGGALKEKVKVGAWSSHRSQDDIADLAIKYQQMGYDCLKFKSDLEDDVVGWCSTIADVAPDMKVILDPNERWDYAFEAKSRIDGLQKIGNVLCLEDPIPRWQLSEYAKLRAYSSVPIVLHVSLPYVLHGQRVKDSIRAIQEQAVDGFNFNCGLANFQRLDHIASAAEKPCWHGSEIDLGILEAMYVHSAAAAASCIWPSDIFGRLIREHDLLQTPLKIEPPFVHLPQGHGLGVVPDMEAIKHYKVSQKEYKQ
ncbi:mandelate racemase/muconate lactonizing enzyme family protein [Spongiimicrobium sp. 3-5]|uniref:mandelate racemase/muconate lactonizing enzyme family protein n=1 Tax=Spongiimicrobium sp. 3-5 TaxID=3332596 RepID=UPI0039804123